MLDGLGAQGRVTLGGLHLEKVAFNCVVNRNDCRVGRVVERFSWSFGRPREDAYLELPRIERLPRGCADGRVFLLSDFRHLRQKVPPLEPSGLPSTRMSLGPGLPFALTTGSNCHLPLTARYCLRLASRPAVLQSNYIPLL